MSSGTNPGWNGIPEIVASGSPWEIGFAHGSGIPSRIANCIKNYERLFLETAEADWEKSKALASSYLPALEENEPDLIEEMKGIAAGAGVDFLDILALNLRSEISLTNYSDGCTSVTTTNSETSEVFLAQNWDWVGEAGDHLTFFDYTKNGKPRLRMLGEAGIVAKFGFNDAGVGVCMNAIRCGTVAKNQLPIHLAMRRVLECQSFDEALTMLQEKGVASCANLMIADKSGKIATIECTPKGLAPIFPEPGSSVTFHTNHLWSKDVPQGIWDHPSANSFSRLERIRVLSQGQRANAAMIRSWLCDQEGTPVSICRSTPPNAKGIERMETLCTIIMDLGRGTAELSIGKPSLNPPIRIIAV
jgi:isopenicillin-N N-acyltransferase like protein